jgi:hypothetical protein
LLAYSVRGREDLAQPGAGNDVFDRLVCLRDGGRSDRAHRRPELVDLGPAEGGPDGVSSFLEAVELLVG